MAKQALPQKGNLKPAATFRPSRKPLFLWGGLALAALLILAGIMIYMLGRAGRLSSVPGINRLTVTKEFTPGGTATPGKPTAPTTGTVPSATPGREATHTVTSGENLWEIAKGGTLVSTPWQWSTILVQNRDKIDYAFLSEEDGSWKVFMEKGKVLKVRTPGGVENPAQERGPTAGQYAVQILSLPENRLNEAKAVVKTLLGQGRYAYLYRKEDQGKPFYRIRVGFFATADEAKQAGEDIASKDGGRHRFSGFWVMRPSPEERQGKHLDFGVQETHPWIVELPERKTQSEALSDVHTVSSISDFAYIAQTKDHNGAHYSYHARLGYFGSEEAARLFIASKKQAQPLLGAGSPVLVQSFQEALPGQILKLVDSKS
jgi:sporulation related protein